jgi:hypothetical protein
MPLPQKVKEILKRKPFLVWYVKDRDSLSPESVLESVLNYGDWRDFLEIKDAIGIEKTRLMFENLKNRKRVNLRPATINYFSLYFAKYA